MILTLPVRSSCYAVYFFQNFIGVFVGDFYTFSFFTAGLYVRSINKQALYNAPWYAVVQVIPRPSEVGAN
jgi:hypothetical protein